MRPCFSGLRLGVWELRFRHLSRYVYMYICIVVGGVAHFHEEGSFWKTSTPETLGTEGKTGGLQGRRGALHCIHH